MYSHTNSVVLSILVIYLFANRGSSEICGNSQIEERINAILSLYDRDELPSKVGDVLLDLEIHHVNILEKAFSVQLLANLRMTWSDRRLNWNSTMYNCTYTLLDIERIWQPDIVILNGGANEAATGDPQRAEVDANGKVRWPKIIDVTIPCFIDLKKWPNDIQTCKFKFGSRRHTIEEISIAITNNKYNTNLESESWKLLSSSGKVQNVYRVDEVYNIGEWTVSLQRYSPAHSTATSAIFVSIFLEFIAAALLPPLARVPLCACIALSVTLWLFATLLRLPGTGTAPLVLSLMSAVLIITCLAALFAALVQRIAKHQSPPPSIVRRLLTKVAAIIKIMPVQNTDYGDGTCAWIAAATLLDQCLLVTELFSFIIILCVYIILVSF